MTNTKFRKRALLSSVAMLLVAILALGSATFAWFASNPNANAKGVNLKTNAGSGLVILTDSEYKLWSDISTEKANAMFDHDNIVLDAVAKSGVTLATTSTRSDLETYGNGRKIMPLVPKTNATDLSAANSWYTAEGTAYDDGTAKTGTYAATSLTHGSNAFVEKIYTRTTDVTSSDTASISSITVSWSDAGASTNIKNALRVAILDTDGKIIGIWKPTGKTASSYDGSAVATSLPQFTNGSACTSFTGNDVVVDNTATGTYVTVVAYLDGEDGDCESQYAVSIDTILSTLNVAFVGASA
ncbi:hypothetical protein [Ruminococcus sp.]|uniref:hypothetical protein n=1 Tax=Ruminococcus sp. TaxID=41978 RepID=UPI002E81BC23|nr:hypothetical protein [Ruminococcus sp.]MEE3492247.1 hypothetical protein [Ruminococcus sp.]